MPLDREGPALEVLQHRLGDLPADFLANPEPVALLHDVLRARAAAPTGRVLGAWRERSRQQDLSLLPALCWLLDAPDFRALDLAPAGIWHLLTDIAPRLAQQASLRQFLNDPDRREELLRLTLAELGLRPAGETPAQAQDRLSSISSFERARVLDAARAAEVRAREIREALRRKAAQEGADKWARE